MTKKIFNSIFCATLAVLLISTVFIGSVLYSYFGNMQRDALAEQTGIVAAEYEKNGEAYLTAFSSQSYRITLISSDGTVLFDSVKDATALENHLGREEVTQALAEDSGSSERFSDTLLEKTYYNAKKLSNGNIIRVSHTKSSVYSLLIGLLQPIAAVLLVAFILSFVLSHRLSNHIVKPLENLDLEHPLENDTYDELSAVLSKIERQRKTLLKREDELKQKNDEFSAVTENMNEGLILIGTDSEIISINSAARKIFLAERDCIGRNIITVNRSPEFTDVAGKCIKGKSSDCLLTIYGHEYQVNANPVMIDEKAAGACILIFDITEKSRNERIRREFTANVSHELKTPLHSIMGAAELLKNGIVKPEDEKQFAGRIYDEASRLVTLVEDIIRLSQLDEGVITEKESVNLTEVAKEAADSVKEEAASRNITVAVSGADVQISGIKRLVYEIAYNLCDNAVRYNNENGSVKIEIESTQSGAVLSVSDSGIGIPEDSLERIFERFYRVDKSHSRETGGTGLGLSIVKHAAEYLGAEITVSSTLGKGTRISVLFPKI
ncbi:MAG: PAS domain S-box protein [Clostridiales bacterium]|nr:PAS domain S-box protein [Clostridiales bacterium]